MRYPASENAEIIRLVEASNWPPQQTLEKLRHPARHVLAGTTAISPETKHLVASADVHGGEKTIQ